MKAFSITQSRSLAWFAIVVLVAASLLPFLTTQRADAAQVTSRSVEMATSEPGATESYQISFTVPDNGVENVGAFRVEFCDNNPLPNQSCVFNGIGNDIPNLDSATASTGTFDGETITMSAPTASDHWLTFTLGSQTDPSSDTTFDMTVDNIVNPNNSTDSPNDNNSFFVRLYVYSTTSPFAPTQGTGNTFATTNQTNEGGAVATTVEQITLEAVVQESLNFCVSEIDPTANCGGLGSHTGIVDLGVLDNTTPIASVVENAYAQLSTNAYNGAVIEYFAEDEFKVSGATCGETDIAATESVTDQCINWDDTEGVMTPGTEEWGTAVSSINAAGVTTAFTGNVAGLYDLDTAGEYMVEDPVYGSGTTPTPGGAYELANSGGVGGVVDNEELVIDYAATVAPTTPTGQYSVTLTYIATTTY